MCFESFSGVASVICALLAFPGIPIFIIIISLLFGDKSRFFGKMLSDREDRRVQNYLRANSKKVG